MNCQDTGKPLVGIGYALQTASGKTVTGVTGADGKTQKICSAEADAVQLVIEQQADVMIA